MARSRTAHVCTDCGVHHPTWTGRCHACGGWGTVEVAPTSSAPGVTPATAPPPVRPLGDLVGEGVGGGGSVPSPVGIDEVDRVLGGGIVPGSVTLLSGEPGIGKSTLTLQVAVAVASTGAGSLLVAGEEAPAQIAARAARLGSIPPQLSVIDHTDADAVAAAIDQHRPALCVVDSIQTLRVDGVDSAPGTPSQIRETTARLTAAAKRSGTSVLLIGHVTKDGSIAGPRVLEHLVDTVLTFVGDRHHDLRFLRALKHRFGPTSEVGVFEMTAAGIRAVADPSARFLDDRRPGTTGSVVAPILDGHRPLLAEIQSLVVPYGEGACTVRTEGVATGRAHLVTAVLEQRAGVPLAGREVLAAITGGLRVDEPAADLPLALAILSAITGRPVAADTIAVGELGLGGEVRSVPRLDHRLAEAHRLGFRTALVPPTRPSTVLPSGLRVRSVESVADLLGLLDATTGPEPRRTAPAAA